MSRVWQSMRRHGKALGILIAVLGFFGLAVVGPLVGAFVDQRDERDQYLKLLADYKSAIGNRAGLEAELAQLQQQGRSASGLVEGNSPALAAARLQNDIRTIVESNGGQVRSTQNLPASSINAFEKVDVACDLSIPMSRLKDIVYQLETHTPYLFIDKIDIRMPENWQPADENAAAPNLEVRWVVSGYRWVGS